MTLNMTMKATNYGHGLYWHGATNTYNVEGYGYFKTIADARACADTINEQRKQKELADAQAKVANGAIRCERIGDTVRVYFPEAGRISMARSLYGRELGQAKAEPLPDIQTPACQTRPPAWHKHKSTGASV